MLARLLLPVLLLTSLAQANWYTRSEDHGQTIIEEFTVATDGWQDRVQQWQFKTPDEADHFLNRRGIQIQEQPTHEDTPELRGKSQSLLWNPEQKWNADWERKFSEWILKEVDTGFWVRYQVATDCADVLYSLRWIFARINKLEMASRLAGSGSYFTHRSVRDKWSHLPTAEKWYEDKRFRAALNYLLDNTYTHSLMSDSYPISIDRKAIQPGVYHLDIHRESGHTQIINRTDQQEGTILPFTIIQSTVPREVRELNISGFWYNRQPIEGKGGLLQMRWPLMDSGSVRLVAAEQMPFFSKEQYQKDFLRTDKTPYFQEVYLRLNPNLDMQAVLNQAYESLKQMFLLRVTVVENGYKACGQGQCPKGSAAYEEWSTPSRDGRIGELIDQIANLKNFNSGLKDPADLKNDFFEFGGEKYSLEALKQTWMAKAYSSEPGDQPEIRWGISAQGIQSWIRNLFQTSFAGRAKLLQQGKMPKEFEVSLNKAFSHVTSYCQFAPLVQCQLLTEKLESEKSNFAQRNLTYQEWLNRIPWMMSDPKETAAHQWGDQSKDQTWLQTSGSRAFGTSNEGWVWKIEGSGAWKVWKTEGKNLRIAMEGGESNGVGFLNPQFSVYKVSENRFQIQNMNTGISFQEELGMSPDRIERFGQTLLLVDTNAGRYKIGRWQNQQWTWIAQGRGVEFSSPSELPILLVGNERGSTVVDFSEDEVRMWPTSIPTKAIAKSVNSDFIILGAFVLIKNSGEVRSAAFLGMSIMQRAGNFGFEIQNVNPMRVRSFVLNSNAEPSFGKVYEGTLYIQGNTAAIYTQQESLFLRWNGKDLSQVQKLADEERIDAVIGDYVIGRAKGMNQRLRKGNQILFQAKGGASPKIGFDQRLLGVEEYNFFDEVVTFWKGQSPQDKIMSRHYDNMSSHLKYLQDLEVGVISFNGIWVL